MSDGLPVGICETAEFEALAAALNSTALATSLCEKLLVDTSSSDLALNTVFLLLSGALVFIMHAGFAMLCAGAIRHKNTMNILLQTILDAASSALFFYLVGYAFAYGVSEGTNAFIGVGQFALVGFTEATQPSGFASSWADWFFQWAFAATAATIPAGCVAERFNFNAYLGYNVLMSAFVYPVVVHWAWSSYGWLNPFYASPLFGIGYVDFAGSGVVHMTGAFCGLTACWLVGPRLGRFDSNGQPVEMPGHSPLLVVLGTCLLWFGWYGFNPGSVLNITIGELSIVAGRAAVCTTLSGGASALTALAIGFARRRAWDLVAVCNGALVGFVSITAGCHVVQPWAAIIIGMTGCCVFEITCELFLKLRLDDPLSAAPMHGFGGMWGVWMVGLFAEQEFMEQVYGANALNHWGAFFGGGGNLFACQIVGSLCIIGWTVGVFFPFFFVLRSFNLLRISAEDEHAGLDVSKHGGQAYSEGTPGINGPPKTQVDF